MSDLLRSDSYLSMGKYCEQFEKEFTKVSKTKYAATVSTGLAAIEVALRGKGITAGEVVVPTNTFGASALAVVTSGATPVYCDIAPDMSMDFDDMKKRVTKKTRAIMPVHIGGIISSKIKEMKEFCEKKGLVMIEDAAHAHGSRLGSLTAGSMGEAGAFSFFTTKVMTTGEGGMVVTSDPEVYDFAKRVRGYNKVKGSEIGEMGYNWKMTEIQAVVGIAQLKILDDMLRKRRAIAKAYDDMLAPNRVFAALEVDDRCVSSYYKYIRLVPKGKKPAALQEHLQKKYDITLGGYVYDVPLHRQKMLGKYARNKNSYPMADFLCAHHICLPLYPQMGESEVHHVVDSLAMASKDLGWKN